MQKVAELSWPSRKMKKRKTSDILALNFYRHMVGVTLSSFSQCVKKDDRSLVIIKSPFFFFMEKYFRIRVQGNLV